MSLETFRWNPVGRQEPPPVAAFLHLHSYFACCPYRSGYNLGGQFWPAESLSASSIMLHARKLWFHRQNVRRKLPTPLRVGLERLDDRIVPAGNVTVEFVPGALFLTGDGLGNNVQIHSGDVPNQIVIQGIDTTLNGSTES